MSVDFIDSNVVLYLFDETAATKRKKAEALIRNAIETRSGIISFQVVQETLNVLLHKIRRPAAAEDARRVLDSVLSPLWTVMPNADLYRRALDVRSRYRFSFFDALIVAAALEAKCARLLSEDLQHRQRIEGMLVVNPFAD